MVVLQTMLGSLLLILNGKMNRKLLRHCLLLKKPAHKGHFEKNVIGASFQYQIFIQYV